MSICRPAGSSILLVIVAGVIVAGCSSSPRFATRKDPATATKEKPTSSPGSASTTASRTPPGKILLTLEGVASYYADDYHGKLTSNGETFDMNDLTAAHRTLPFGTKVRVTNLENSKSVTVRINDRGPFVEGRIIDLSLAAAKEIELIRQGTVRVRLDVLEWGDGR